MFRIKLSERSQLKFAKFHSK